MASEGISAIIDALVDICDPKELSSEEMKNSPCIGHIRRGTYHRGEADGTDSTGELLRTK